MGGPPPAYGGRASMHGGQRPISPQVLTKLSRPPSLCHQCTPVVFLGLINTCGNRNALPPTHPPHPGFCTLVQLLCPSVEPEPNRTLKSRPAHHPEELYLCVSWGGWADSVLRKGPQLGNWSSWGPNCWNGPHFTQKVSCSPFPKCVSLQYIHFLHEML